MEAGVRLGECSSRETRLPRGQSERGVQHFPTDGNITGWLEHRMPDGDTQTGLPKSSKALSPCKSFNYPQVSGSLLKSSKQKMTNKIYVVTTQMGWRGLGGRWEARGKLG